MSNTGSGRYGQGGLEQIGVKKKPGTYSFQPNDVYPKGTTGVYASGGQPVSQPAGVKVAGEKKVTKDGRVYTYRNGVLVGVTRGPQDVERANIQAGINQARTDANVQNPPIGNVDISTGGTSVPKSVQTSTDVLAALLKGGNYGAEYDPVIGAIQSDLDAKRAALTAGQYGLEYDPLIESLQGQLTANQQALDTGSYLNPITALQGQLNTLYGQAQGNIGAANTALMNYLAANMANPYANVQAQGAVSAPQFADLLGEQGVSTAPLQAEAALQSQIAGDTGAQFKNLLGVLGSLQGAGAQSRGVEAQMADTFAKQMLEANKGAYGQQLLGMGEDLRQGLQEQIRQGTLDIGGLKGQKGAAKTGLESQISELGAGLAEIFSKRAGAKSDVQDKLIDLVGKGGTLSEGDIKDIFGAEKPKTTGTKTAAKGPTKAEKAAARKDVVAGAKDNYDTFKDAVKALHPNFTGSLADARKKFPKLAAAFKK